MTPLGKSRHLAARMGRWSASHWKTATFGWLAFVVAAFAIGSVIGTKNLDPNKAGSGESGHVQSVLADEFKQPANENVIIKSTSSTVDSPEFRHAVASVIVALQGQLHVRDISSPFVAGNAGQISADRHAALVQFKMQGTDLAVSDKQVAPVEAAVAAVQKSYPSLTIGQVGDASVDEALNKQIGKDLEKAGLYSLPILEECALAAISESIAVAQAAGVKISIADPRRAWTMASAGLPPEFKTSMLQSLQSGNLTEVDYIHGSVVRWGAKLNVPTPVNATLVALVKGIEYARSDYPGKA